MQNFGPTETNVYPVDANSQIQSLLSSSGQALPRIIQHSLTSPILIILEIDNINDFRTYFYYELSSLNGPQLEQVVLFWYNSFDFSFRNETLYVVNNPFFHVLDRLMGVCAHVR